MKTITILFLTAMITSTCVHAQSRSASLEQTIQEFFKATMARDVHGMHYLLHEKFQSATEAGILSKSDYMKMLGHATIGGTELQSHILSVDLAETSAAVKVRISGRSESAELFIHLYKNEFSSWQILHVLPCFREKV